MVNGKAEKHRTEWCAAANKLSLYEMRKSTRNMKHTRKIMKDQSDDERTPDTRREDGAHHILEDMRW